MTALDKSGPHVSNNSLERVASIERVGPANEPSRVEDLEDLGDKEFFANSAHMLKMAQEGRL